MKPQLKTILTRFLVFCLALAGLAALLFVFLPSGYYLPVFPLMFLLVAGITFSIFWLLVQKLKRPQRFTTLFTLATTIKLFAFLIFMVVYLLLNRSEAAVFLITFFLLYLIFSIYEVVVLLKYFKK